MNAAEALAQIATLAEQAATEPPDKGALYALISDIRWVIKNTDTADNPQDAAH